MFAILRPELCLKRGESPSFTSFCFRDLGTFKKRITTKRTDEFFSKKFLNIYGGRGVKKKEIVH